MAWLGYESKPSQRKGGQTFQDDLFEEISGYISRLVLCPTGDIYTFTEAYYMYWYIMLGLDLIHTHWYIC